MRMRVDVEFARARRRRVLEGRRAEVCAPVCPSPRQVLGAGREWRKVLWCSDTCARESRVGVVTLTGRVHANKAGQGSTVRLQDSFLYRFL